MSRFGEPAFYEQDVPFHDCDPLAIVWHGHYFKYFEFARTELMKKHRLDVSDFIQMGYRQVVIDAQCRYASPLRYGDRFRVSAKFLDIEMRLKIGYEIRNLTQDNKRVARAWTVLVTTETNGTMLMETPDEIRNRILQA